MARLFSRSACITVMLLAGAAIHHAQQSPSSSPDRQSNFQAASATALLPVYGTDLRIDKSWVDSQLPGRPGDSASAGVSTAMQQTWDSLKAGGLSILRIEIDAGDMPASVNRVTNLCVWAKNNNVKLVVVLRGTNSEPGYPAKVRTLVQSLIKQARQSAYSDSYFQIAAYQLGDELNQSGLYGRGSSSALQQLVLQAAQSVRAAEKEGWAEAGRETTPLMVSASFDYELIRARAIAGAPLTNEAYNQAYSALVRYLQPFAASQDIDLVSVTWYPGSISAGNVEKPPVLLRSLTADLPRKAIVFTTGFSTAFHSPEEQKSYYARALANLSNLRASGGESSTFLGVIFHEARNGRIPPAVPGVTQRMANWDWPSKADELAAMWDGKGKSDDMAWWWAQVRGSMGLVDLNGYGQGKTLEQPVPQTMRQFANTVSEVNAVGGQVPTQPPGQNSSVAYPSGSATPAGDPGPPGAPPAGTAPSGAVGFKQALQGKAQQGTMVLLDRVFDRLNQTASGFGNGRAGRAGNVDPCFAGDPSATPQGCPSPGQYSGTYQHGQPAGTYAGDPSVSGGQFAGANSAYPNSGNNPSPDTSGTYNPGQYPGGANNLGGPQQGQYPPTSPAAGQYQPRAAVYPGGASGNSYPQRPALSPGARPGLPNGNLIARGPATPTAAQGLRPDVSVNAREMLYAPVPPRPGQKVVFQVTVRNQGNATAQHVSLVLSLRADGKVVSGPPMQFPLPAGAGHQAVWETTMPPAQQVQLFALVIADGDTNPADKRAAITLPSSVGAPGNSSPTVGSARPPMGPRPGGVMVTANGAISNRAPGNTRPPQGLRPDVSVNAREMLYAPVPPRPGQKVVFQVTVRNQGNATAQHVSLVLSLRADGKVVSGPPMQFPLPAGAGHQAVWETTMPSAQQVQLFALVIADGDTNPADKRAAITLPSGGGPGARSTRP